jgi:hypothetical protein
VSACVFDRVARRALYRTPTHGARPSARAHACKCMRVSGYVTQSTRSLDDAPIKPARSFKRALVARSVRRALVARSVHIHTHTVRAQG